MTKVSILLNLLALFATVNCTNPLENKSTADVQKSADEYAKRMNAGYFNSQHGNFFAGIPSPNKKTLKTFASEINKDTVAAYFPSKGNNIVVAANVKVRQPGTISGRRQTFDYGNVGLGAGGAFNLYQHHRVDPVQSGKTLTVVQPMVKPLTPQENARPHAEQQLLAYQSMQERLNSPSGPVTRRQSIAEGVSARRHSVAAFPVERPPRPSVIGINKPACERCSLELNAKKIAHTSVGGLPKGKVTNFAKPFEIGPLKANTYDYLKPPTGHTMTGASTPVRPGNTAKANKRLSAPVPINQGRTGAFGQGLNTYARSANVAKNKPDAAVGTGRRNSIGGSAAPRKSVVLRNRGPG